MDIKIRKARLKDVPKILELWRDLIRHHDKIGRKSIFNEHKKDSDKIFEKWLTRNIRSSNGFLLVADDNGKLIGYILSIIKKNVAIYRIEKLGYISDLFVEKQYRGKGISSKLKDESFKWFKKKRIKHSSISLHSYNKRAHSIYKKWGFKDHSINMRKKL